MKKIKIAYWIVMLLKLFWIWCWPTRIDYLTSTFLPVFLPWMANLQVNFTWWYEQSFGWWQLKIMCFFFIYISNKPGPNQSNICNRRRVVWTGPLVEVCIPELVLKKTRQDETRQDWTSFPELAVPGKDYFFWSRWKITALLSYY